METKVLATNTFYSAVTNFSDILLFALMIMAARSLGATDFGAFSFALSLATVFLTFSTQKFFNDDFDEVFNFHIFQQIPTYGGKSKSRTNKSLRYFWKFCNQNQKRFQKDQYS